jgi:hypothetical protein
MQVAGNTPPVLKGLVDVADPKSTSRAWVRRSI